MRAIFLLATLLACGPKKPAAVDRAVQPAPLAPRPFEIPTASKATLSNGLSVLVVENHEVPFINFTLAFRAGGWSDSADRPGLASMSMDMLNEGAGDMDAAALSQALRKLASELSTGASADGASISLSTLKKNVAPSLDLMALVLTKPTFPAAEFEILQKRRLADLKTERDDPQSMARRVWNKLQYGDTYLGNLTTEAGYKAMTTAELSAWTNQWLHPQTALLLVGGDTTLAEIQPLLEARFGSWKPTSPVPTASVPGASVAKQAEKTTIYLVDKPGASQSVLRAGRFIGDRAAADDTAFELANGAVGGMFTARINMNLREAKGYTYGARSYPVHSFGPDQFVVTTSVRADATIDSIKEIMRELSESLSSRPITAAELENARGYELGTWPLSFETAGGLLGGLSEIWRYNLPEDWLSGYPGRVRAVDVAAANAAWSARVNPSALRFVVVGDAASLRAPLSELGYPVVELSVDGVATAAQ